jgi:hypothetical protein
MAPPINAARDQERFRKFTLALVVALTLATVYFVAGGLTDALPFAKGYGGIAAALAGFVWVIFILPAFLLAAFNRLIGVAFALAALGLICYTYDALFRFIAWVFS